MAEQTETIKAVVKDYILAEFLPGEDPGSLTDDTPLISTGVLDSIATIKLVNHLENRYGISFGAHEMSVDYLDSLGAIAGLVESKVAGA